MGRDEEGTLAALTRSPTRLYLEHALGLSDFMLNVELSCRARDNVRLIHEDEILERGSKELRQRHGWPVSIDWQGREETIWIIPDRLFGLQFLDRPKGKDTRYFAVEYDRGSMPVTRSNIHQSSYLRKFLGYASTYQQQLHRKHLGVEFFYVLNVTTNAERVDNLITAYQAEALPQPSSFLFTPKFPKPSIDGFEDVFAMPWRNVAGKTVSLPS